VDDLVVNNELTATVVNNQSADGAAALVEGVFNALVKVALRNDRDTALHIAGLSESDKGAVLNVKDAVCLVDRAEHGLDDHRGLRVGDEARLLVELASEEVNTSVAALVSHGGAGDADDLARTTLEDKNVADADKVGRDRNRLGGSSSSAAGLDDANILLDAVTVTNWAPFVSDKYFFAVVVMVIMVVVMEGVRDAVDSAFHTTTEGVVVTVVVVVTHLASVGMIYYCSSLENLDLVASRSRGLDTLYTDLTVGVRVPARNVEGLSLEFAIVTDDVRRRRAARDVRGVLARTFE
jgi:predicted secreted protein